MIVVPRSHQGGLYQVEPADTSISFTNVQCTIPSEYQPIGVDMLPGDVLFFDGKTIHGSEKNQRMTVGGVALFATILVKMDQTFNRWLALTYHTYKQPLAKEDEHRFTK